MSVAVKESVAEETTMRVKKRNGIFEPVDVNKIVRAVGRCAKGLKQVDTLRVATKTIGGLYEGATTKELDKLSINTAATLIADPFVFSINFNGFQARFNQRAHGETRC
jgi:ribonucleoside-diphosphate reductase alpha chain